MSVILSLDTFNKLEEKLGTDAAKQVYQVAEAIYEEVAKRSEERINGFRVNFTDDELKRASRKELIAVKEDLMLRIKENREELTTELRTKVKSLTTTISVSILFLFINLIITGGMIFSNWFIR